MGIEKDVNIVFKIWDIYGTFGTFGACGLPEISRKCWTTEGKGQGKMGLFYVMSQISQ